MKNDLQYFSHTDLGLCSFLVLMGHSVKFLEKNGRQGTFFFERSQGLERLVEAYWSRRSVEIIPAGLFEIAKHLKSRVDSYRGN